VDADSLVTPWLVVFWLATVVRGLRRAHAVLGQFYNLSDVRRLSHSTAAWKEVSGYFLAFGLKPTIAWMPLVLTLCRRYSRTTNWFLFGVPSQQRVAILK
jgi:hypothetical protein